MPRLAQDFAISQNWRCALLKDVKKEEEMFKNIDKNNDYSRKTIWYDCDKTKKNVSDEMSLMGYSMRTLEFRYTAWFHYNRPLALPLLDTAPYAEELYDHRNEKPSDFTHLEIVNLVKKGGFESVIKKYREKLLHFIRTEIKFRGPFKRL
jgi:hypothetical protein